MVVDNNNNKVVINTVDAASNTGIVEVESEIKNDTKSWSDHGWI